MKLTKHFFKKDAEIVAKNLLGCILCRKIKNKILKAKIIETEAYYDEKDPASRACKNGDLRKTMEMQEGTILVYGVHNNWLFNIVTGKKGKPQAVLIRSLKPINFEANASGPGLLTKAMSIDKKFHKKDITYNKEIWIEKAKRKEKIYSSFRIGVKKDLPKKLRFFIKV